MDFLHVLDLKMTKKIYFLKKSTFKILPQIMETKVLAVIELGTCGSVERSYTQCTTETDTMIWPYMLS